MATYLSGTEEEALRIREAYDVHSEQNRARGSDYGGDFHAGLARLRSEAPVQEGAIADLLGHPVDYGITELREGRFYSCLTWDTCSEVLRNTDVYSSSVVSLRLGKLFGRSILEMGGEEHRRYRALVHRAFTRAQADWWVDRWIAGIVDGLISAFEHDGRADLNLQLCGPLPIFTITASFGIPPADALKVKALLEQMFLVSDPPAQHCASREIAERIEAIAARRRREPADDLITVLTREQLTEADGTRRQLSDEEIMGFSRLLLGAGAGTTWRQLGIVLYALLTHPGLLERARADRGFLRPVVEEAMRWEPNDTIFWRLATRDVVLGGLAIPAGSIVEVSLAAANRDPARWDRSEVFDPDRTPETNLGFGGGPHICLGIHVARAEMLVALNAILDRLPKLRLEAAADVRVMGLRERSVNALPVEFG